MWGKRKRRTRLSRLETLRLLAEAMEQAERQERDAQQPEHEECETATVAYSCDSSPAVPTARPGLLAADVPVDNSAGPASSASDQDATQLKRDVPAQRTGESAHHVR
jgi:hypothetical protein